MRTPLVIVGVGGLCLLLAVWFLDLGAQPQVPDDGGDEPPPTEPTGPEVVDRTPATLEVLLFDENGRSLDDARLTLTPLAGGAAREAVGPRTFEDVAPGAWRVEVLAEELWPHNATIQVEPGARQREVVQLFDHLRVSGTLRTRFGTPLGQHTVWFLRPGEEHPATPDAGADLVRGQADGDGVFEVRLPAPGDWRVSVGAPGLPLFVSPPASLRPGGPERAEVVVGGVTLLEVRAVDLPVRFQRGRGFFDVLILTRRRRAAPDDWGPESWRVMSGKPYPREVALQFVGLSSRPTYALGLGSRMQGQFIGREPFQLVPDARVVVTLHHPPGDAVPETHLLSYEVAVEPLAADVAPPGVRWK